MDSITITFSIDSPLVSLFSLQVFADKEVILSGGAINSPQLLMLSGVGNADDLKQLGIAAVQHLPGNYNEERKEPCVTSNTNTHR